MAAKKPGEGQTALPPMMVGRVTDCMRLIEDLVSENIELFGDNIAKHRAMRKETSSTTLTPLEAAQVTAAMGVDANDPELPARIAAVQNSDLRSTEEVPMQEVLLVAGVATAPAAIEAACRLVALVEMPDAEYRKAREGNTLREEINKAAVAFELETSAEDGRARASAALAHFQAAAGVDSGEARSLILRTVLEALGQAMENAPNLNSAFGSLTGSLERTDGTAA